MVEIINGVKNVKKLNIGKGLKSTPIINKASGLSSNPVANKKGGNLIINENTISMSRAFFIGLQRYHI